MTEVSVEFEGWASFRTPRLAIEPSLSGARHSVRADGRTVTIQLPKAMPSPDEKNDAIRWAGWRIGNGEPIPLQYEIDEIEILVSIPGSRSVPAELLNRHPNAVDLLTQSCQDELTRLATESYSVAERVFERWVRFMRWKTGRWEIARNNRESLDTGWGRTLRQAATGKRLWVSHAPFVLYRQFTVTTDHWEAVQAAFEASEEPPVFVDLLLDAEMHLATFDVRRSIIDAAVAAETYVRATVQRSLPEGLGDATRDLIDEANVRPVMQKLFPEALATLGLPSVPKETISVIHSLLDARNKLLHTGHALGVDGDKCSKYLKSVRKLLENELGKGAEQ